MRIQDELPKAVRDLAEQTFGEVLRYGLGDLALESNYFQNSWLVACRDRAIR